MKILLLNPPHPSIGSRIPVEHLPPLGLLSIGGPLLDAGHDVQLLDAEFGPMPTQAIVDHVRAAAPDALFIGHSGSTSGHPGVAGITRAIRRVMPAITIVYGGVFPTFHWKDILSEEPQIDVIVRGEGEETAVRLAKALEENTALAGIPGIAFMKDGKPVATEPAPLILDLDRIRVGWELVDLSRYSYWGKKRAVVIQFSRGCPHNCTYCGQRGFWKRWRHRDPVRFAREIAWLHRKHGVEVFNLADENPTASRQEWRALLDAVIAENITVTIIGSTRADDIVRDADILHLYREAGVARFLLGTESCDEETLSKIRKGSVVATDREAIRLLRENGILSMATYVIGFEEETDRDYWRGLKQLLSYDPDQIQMLFATPHRWTPYYNEVTTRRVIQKDRSRWDYKHQVLATRNLAPWRILLWVKFIEAVMQLRPRALLRVLAHPDKALAAAMRWYYRIGRRVWPYEIWNFIFRDHREARGPTVSEFWGAPQEADPSHCEKPLLSRNFVLQSTLLHDRLCSESRRTNDCKSHTRCAGPGENTSDGDTGEAALPRLLRNGANPRRGGGHCRRRDHGLRHVPGDTHCPPHRLGLRSPFWSRRELRRPRFLVSFRHRGKARVSANPSRCRCHPLSRRRSYTFRRPGAEGGIRSAVRRLDVALRPRPPFIQALAPHRKLHRWNLLHCLRGRMPRLARHQFHKPVADGHNLLHRRNHRRHNSAQAQAEARKP
ncbi:MAG: magnesium-protoporphyrin IX monomethyl ester anaerobic oxidative cyclase [Verrucomicrobia bacterium]|nr:magnesium-protoporphyrin IX monomethyl ester anaerobic oxidative cyclase [Verrucomicrobiota bacterium]